MPQQSLHGTWYITRLELHGAEMPASGSITVTADRFAVDGMGVEYTGRVVVDTTPTPHTIDLHFETGPEAGNINRGIWAWHGDDWQLCLAMYGGARPTAFRTAPDTGHALETLSATKPRTTTAQSQKNQGTPAAPAHGVNDAEIEGEWAMVSSVNNGQALAAELVAEGRRSAHDNNVVVTVHGRVMMKATFTVDKSVTPARIDFHFPDSSMRQGIYRLQDDLLTTNYSAAGDPRPHDFTSASGDGRLLSTWKKL